MYQYPDIGLLCVHKFLQSVGHMYKTLLASCIHEASQNLQVLSSFSIVALSHSESKLTIFAKTPFPYSVNSSCMFRSLSAPGDMQYLSSLGKKGEPHYLGTQVVPSPPHLSVIRVWMAA